MATLYVDFTNGNDANNGTSFANRVKTITSGITAARTAPGDVIRMMKSEDPVSLGISATWTNKSNTVTLASALTATIDMCESSWTAATNVTCTTSTTRKEGSNSASIAPAANFTTGKMAYKDLGASTDFSAYSKVTLWIRSSVALQSGDLQIKLCSDATGNTAVNTLTINEALTANNWRPVTINNGGALGSNIRTVALYATRDFGAATILIDDILAANALTLTCLISKNSSATSKEFYPIQSINGTTVKLDYAPDSQASDTIQGYYGTTETVTTYKREPIRISAAQTVQESGTVSSRSLYTGGWNTTDMSTQDGLTFIDGGDDSFVIFNMSVNHIDMERVVTVRGSSGISAASYTAITNCGAVCKGGTSSNQGGILVNGVTSVYISDCYVSNNAASGIVFASTTTNVIANNCIANNNQSAGFNVSGTGGRIEINGVIANNNSVNGIITATNLICSGVTCKDNANGIQAVGGCYVDVLKYTSSGNSNAGLNAASGVIRIHNCDITDSTPLSSSVGRIEISRYNGDINDFRIHEWSLDVASYDVSVVHGTTSRSIKHVISSPFLGENSAFVQKLAPFAVNDSGTVTVSVWVRRSNSTNASAAIRIRNYQNAGLSSDIIDYASAASDTWEELTLSFDPTEKSMIEVELLSWCSAGTTNIYFGDISVSQS